MPARARASWSTWMGELCEPRHGAGQDELSQAALGQRSELTTGGCELATRQQARMGRGAPASARSESLGGRNSRARPGSAREERCVLTALGRPTLRCTTHHSRPANNQAGKLWRRRSSRGVRSVLGSGDLTAAGCGAGLTSGRLRTLTPTEARAQVADGRHMRLGRARGQGNGRRPRRRTAGAVERGSGRRRQRRKAELDVGAAGTAARRGQLDRRRLGQRGPSWGDWVPTQPVEADGVWETVRGGEGG